MELIILDLDHRLTVCRAAVAAGQEHYRPLLDLTLAIIKKRKHPAASKQPWQARQSEVVARYQRKLAVSA